MNVLKCVGSFKFSTFEFDVEKCQHKRPKVSGKKFKLKFFEKLEIDFMFRGFKNVAHVMSSSQSIFPLAVKSYQACK